MKVVINKCYGGFGLSPKAIKRIAELQGKKCYFFKQEIINNRFGKYEKITMKEAETAFVFHAFSIPNPNEYLDRKDWHDMTDNEKRESNERWDAVTLRDRYGDEQRADPVLIQVVEELGEAANGKYAELKVVEIPDGTEYEISEYGGMEHIAEKHQTWG
jgi:hypothetical protein